MRLTQPIRNKCYECEVTICEVIQDEEYKDDLCCIHNESVESHRMCSPCSEVYFSNLTDILHDMKKDGLF